MSEALRADAIEPIAALIQRHAEIDDELERRGANDLLRERDHVRDLLKDAMVRADTIEAIDEVSGCCATIRTIRRRWSGRACGSSCPRIRTQATSPLGTTTTSCMTSCHRTLYGGRTRRGP